jgi:glutamyl aminopeptidase
MNEAQFDLIKKVTEVQSISGFEHNIREVIREEMTPYVDEIQLDGLGGIFGIKKSAKENAPTVMIAAHMDEVGFMVSAITEEGFFRVIPLGGWNPQVVSAQRFTLQTRKGDYPVVSSSIPPHLLRGKENKTQEVKDILFDGGFDSKDEAEEYGVRPGDTIVPDVETIKMANGKTLLGKAWDNRYGVAVVLETVKALKDEELPVNLVIGANVQEEVGLRGTRGAVRKFDPDVFFAVDCSPADDVYGGKDAFGKLGEGTLIRIQDPGFILSKEMREFLLETAEENDILHQYFVSKGGTDAGAAHQLNEGIPSAVIGVVARYIHTHQTLFNIEDYQAALDMTKHIIMRLDEEKIKTLNPKLS